jgi:hypothetical protein
MQFQVNETCPRCGKPVSLAIVEPHPTRTDIALHSYECMDCARPRKNASCVAPSGQVAACAGGLGTTLRRSLSRPLSTFGFRGEAGAASRVPDRRPARSQ